MSLTGEQRNAAYATDRNVAVVAGAGTGKTRVLTQRFVHLAIDLEVPVDRILTLTFTEKAAREMKDRIRAELATLGRMDLARAAEFAPISTIHAFLARMLRENALDAALDPRFAIADEIAAVLLLERAVEETVDGLPPDVREPLVDLFEGEAFLRELYDAARATPHAMAELRPVDVDEDFVIRIARFADHVRTAKVGGKSAARIPLLEALLPRLLALDPAADAEFKEILHGARGEVFREGRELRKEYETLVDRERAREVGRAVVSALVALDENFTRRKRTEGLLDFSDLERCGLDLLRSPAGLAVARGFDHLLVDEYQDTSRIQKELLDLLARNAQRFGVGDEKQSIYRFRYADVAVFRGYESTAASYPLGGSFRSRPEVVAFTNALFDDMFKGTEVRPQPLHAEAPWRPRERECVEVIAPRAPSLAAARRLEAQALARRLRDIVDGAELTISRADREPEPVTYRHCALLLRTMSQLSVYERALTEAGVPYVVVQGRGYYAAREVVDLSHLLLLLADPGDRYRAVGVMTSLLCGVPEADLLHLPPEGALPAAALGMKRPEAVAPERWERLQEFGRRFERWRALARTLPTGDLIETILDETRFAELQLLELDGRRRYANLKKVLRRARQVNLDPLAYARSLLEFRDRELRESEAPIAAETDEAVKIMTVHAAKGLEFPLVAVADLAAGTGSGSGPILRDDGVFGFKLRGADRGRKPPGYRALREREKSLEESEKKRLLYVAYTRAEEHLLLTGAQTERAPSAALAPLLEPRAGVRIVDPEPLLARDEQRRGTAAVRAAVRRCAPLPATVARDAAGAAALLDRVAAVAVPPPDTKPYVAAVADLVEFDRCPRRYRLKRMLGIDEDRPPYESEGDPAPDRPDTDEHPRRELGSAFHAIMDEVGPGTVPAEDVVRRHLPDARPGDLEKIAAWSGWLRDLDVLRGVASRSQSREMPFLTRIAGLPVRGVIDLYVGDGEPLLIDYKTGARGKPGANNVQMAIYLAALRGLGYPVPAQAHLLYVDARQVVEVAAEPVEELIERFRAAHREAEPGKAFAPTPGAVCENCEFRRVCLANGVACPRELSFF